ncbi:exopolyphosphatase PRUNE1-like [Diabrotica virgifera virgifera]|uniref:Exopolyphosphatase PRUNE1-like n=1 Tax=Diabrotica virgifera virgifera TaxID=50390 RepID=A0A6P7FG26_DIAVI|nr:exopolyphosphatase PRUNE1-like [Diabrotica virgifera virgifera]
MESFIEYLQFVKKSLENLDSFGEIHIVLGNESCDIDSSVSATALAYLLHISRPKHISKEALVVAVQNVPAENFLFRTDNCFLYREIQLPLDYLVCRDQIDFDYLVKSKKVTTTLVDHHVVPKNYKILEKTVVQIYDHRPIDAAFDLDTKEVEINIEGVGSCATLIANAIFSGCEDVLFKELGYLLYATILFDTQGLSPDTKRAKELDFQIVEKLEHKFNFTEDRIAVYDRIWNAHNDISTLNPKQILVKDLKMVEHIPVPGLPMLVEDFLKIQGSYEAVRKFAEERDTPLLILVGIDCLNGIRRDVALFSRNEDDPIRNRVLNLLCNCQHKGYDFEFKEVDVSCESVKCFRQGNLTLSRKQIIPVIIDALKLS